jgi:hypothetical protein
MLKECAATLDLFLMATTGSHSLGLQRFKT